MIVFVNSYTQKCYGLVYGPPPRFMFLKLETLAYAGVSCFSASQLSINTSTADCVNTHSAKLPFLKKAAAVIMIVNLARIKDCKDWREGHMHKTN